MKDQGTRARSPEGSPTRSRLVGFALVSASLLGLYIVSLAPGVTWGDSAKLATLSFEMPWSSNAGYHTLHNAIGQLFNRIPVGDVAYRQNVMSAVFGALTCGLLLLLLRALAVGLLASITASLALGVSHVFWHLSVICESYTLTNFLMLLSFLLLIRWRSTSRQSLLAWALFTATLGLTNHLLSLVPLIGCILFILLERRERLTTRTLGVALVSAAAGLLPLAILFALDWHRSGDFQNAIRQLLALDYSGQLFIYAPRKAIGGIVRYVPYLAYQFAGPSIFLGLAGAWRQLRTDPRAFALLTVPAAGIILFTSTYMEQRKFWIMSMSFTIYAVWIGFGADGLMDALRKRSASAPRWVGATLLASAVLVPPLLYRAMPRLTRRHGWTLFTARDLPYRDNARYFLVPGKHGCDGAVRYGREVFTAAPPGACIVADFTPWAVLAYFQVVRGLRPDVILRYAGSEGLEAFIERRALRGPVFLADDEPGAYPIEKLRRRGFGLRPAGPMFQVTRER